MPWFKVDDTFHSHPKSRRAGLAGVGLWALSGSYSMQYKLDGAVPDHFIDGIRRDPGCRCRCHDPRKAAERLEDAGLWLPDGTGFQFHDWKHYQPTADEIEAEREAARERQRRRRARLRGEEGEP